MILHKTNVLVVFVQKSGTILNLQTKTWGEFSQIKKFNIEQE